MRGHVIDVDPSRAVRIRIAFDTIETVRGLADLRASLRHAEPTAYLSSDYAPRSPFTGQASVAGADGPPATLDSRMVSTDPSRFPPLRTSAPPEVLVPAGSAMEIVLDGAVVLPAMQNRVN